MPPAVGHHQQKSGIFHEDCTVDIARVGAMATLIDSSRQAVVMGCRAPRLLSRGPSPARPVSVKDLHRYASLGRIGM